MPLIITKVASNTQTDRVVIKTLSDLNTSEQFFLCFDRDDDENDIKDEDNVNRN